MKKIAFLVICTLMVAGCNIEDEGPGFIQVYAEVSGADLPESFERGKVYDIEVTYLLPNACHVGLGLYANRGGFEGSSRRDIYVAGVASGPATEAECTEEEEELEIEDSFSIRIDENEPFTFYLWEGVDENQKNVYTRIVVPVIDPLPSTSTD